MVGMNLLLEKGSFISTQQCGEQGCTHFALWSVAHKQLRPNSLKKERNKSSTVSQPSLI